VKEKETDQEEWEVGHVVREVQKEHKSVPDTELRKDDK